MIEQGHTLQNWLTFKQAKALGGTVRKGEQGQVVCYADRFTPKDVKQKAAVTGEDAAPIPFLKRYRVFNANQCDGLPDNITDATAPLPNRALIPSAEEGVCSGRGQDSTLRKAVVHSSADNSWRGFIGNRQICNAFSRGYYLPVEAASEFANRSQRQTLT